MISSPQNPKDAGRFSVVSELVRSAKWNIAPTLARHASLLVGMLVTARFVSPEEFGAVAIAASATTLFTLLSQFGVAQAIIGAKDEEEEMVDSLFTTSLLLAACLYLFVHLAAQPVAAFYGNPRLAGLMRVTGLGLIVSLAGAVPLALLQRRLDYRSQAISGFVTSLVGLAAVLPLALSGAGAWTLIVPNLMGSMVGGAYAWFASGYRPRPRLAVSRLSGALNFGASAFVSNLSNFLCNSAVPFVMGKAWSSDRLGLYTFAHNKQGIVFDTIASQATTSLFPILSKVSGDIPRVRAAHLRLLRAALHVLPPIHIALIFGAPYFFPILFGPRWGMSILPFQILCASQIAKTFALGVNPILYAMNRPHISMAVALARLACFAAAMAWCFSRGAGAPEVALAVAGVEVMVILAYLAICLQTLGTSSAEFATAVWAPIAASAALAGAFAAAVAGLGRTGTLSALSFPPLAALLLGLFVAVGRRRFLEDWRLIRSRL